MYENVFINDDHFCIEMFRPQTKQTIYLLSHGGLRRPKLTRYDMLRFYDRVLECHLTATCMNIIPNQELSFTTFKEKLQILNMKHNIYEFSLF